jgi:hypothetical protein
MRDNSSWGAAQILRRVDPYRDLTYNDGSTPQEQYEAWTAFIAEYLRERLLTHCRGSLLAPQAAHRGRIQRMACSALPRSEAESWLAQFGNPE